MTAIKKLDQWLDNGAKIILILYAAAALIICLEYQYLAITFYYPLDYGEAPLVDHAMQLAAGQNIYRADLSAPPYTISNYPPVYIALLAISVKFLGPAATFIAGRIISALSAWAASVFVALIIYESTRDRFAALIAGATLLAFPYVVYWSSLLRIDLLALAFSMAALYLLVRRPQSTSSLVLVSILLVAAICTRQSYALAAPLAAFVWLLSYDIRRAFCLAALVGSLVLIIFLIINQSTHGGFYYNIVTANINAFSWNQVKDYMNDFRDVTFLAPFIAVVSFFLVRRWNPIWPLAAPYLFGALLSAATIGKIGSNINYLLELCAAMSIAVGVVLAWSRARISTRGVHAVIIIALVLSVSRMVSTSLEYTKDLRDYFNTAKDISALSAAIHDKPGPILIDEYMGLLTLQGRALIIQPFEMTQLALAGKWDQTPLLGSINNREFTSIIVYEPLAKERWTKEMLDAVERSYILSDTIAGNKIYVPN